MNGNPPNFDAVADAGTKRAFVHGRPEAVEWLTPGTKLFKWTKSVTTARGVSPWWQFLESRRLVTGSVCSGLREMQTYARRLQAQDRDFARTRFAVTHQWNPMTRPIAIELAIGTWGYIGKCAGQLRDSAEPDVYFIGGEYQVWIPGLRMADIRQISVVPYMLPADEGRQ